MVRFAYWEDNNLRNPVLFKQINDAEQITEELRGEISENGQMFWHKEIKNLAVQTWNEFLERRLDEKLDELLK